jgi:malonyl-CoA/methylmalonyl-CoA synthetase
MENCLFDALIRPLLGRQTPFLLLPDGSALSGDAFLARVAQLAHALAAAGVGVGDRVCLQVAKSPDALAAWGATVALGAVYLPLNPAYTPAELQHFLNDATPRVLVCDPARADRLRPLAEAAGARLMTLGADGRGSLAEAAAAAGTAPLVPVARGEEDLAALLYTSGTTGRSKGAMLTHGNLLSNARVLAREWRFSAQDVLLNALPIFHTHGLFVATNIALLTGGAMILLPGFDPAEVRRWLPRASVMMGVPTFYSRLLADPGFGAADTAGVRLFISGSAPLLEETHRAFHDRTGQTILERYGMTETNMNTSNPYDGPRRAGTVGLPLPGVELRLMRDGHEVGPGEIGAIEVRGPNVFRGYWNLPDKTAEDLGPDGWFKTGDLGQRDPDGYLRIVGRSKDLVISGGFNVYPKEIEGLLDALPGVRESAVIGVPHPDLGEAVFAVLTGSADPEAALQAIGDRLARFKQPRAAVLLDDLPRNAMGKVQKNLLRDRFMDWFTA